MKVLVRSFRKGNSLKRFRPFSEPADSKKRPNLRRSSPSQISSPNQDDGKGGVEFKGGSLHDGCGGFDGFGGSAEHLALLSIVLQNAGSKGDLSAVV